MKFGDLAGIIINGMFKLHLQSKTGMCGNR